MPETSFLDGFYIPFRNYVLADIEINSFIEGRFYGHQLATFYTQNTSFPLVTFWIESGEMPNFNIYQRFNINIRAFSNVSYDEAYRIYKAIFERLGGQNGPLTIPTRIIIRPLTTPSEGYDERARLFSVGSRFAVTWIP